MVSCLPFLSGLYTPTTLFKRYSLVAQTYPAAAPSLADDLSLIVVTPLALQKLLDIAYRYACKWRLIFNAPKSSVSQSRSQGANLKLNTCNISWHLGPAIVLCKRSYIHLGIIINEKCRLSEQSKKVIFRTI